MKIKYKVKTAKGEREKSFSYIPLRFIIGILLSVLMTLAVIGIVVSLCQKFTYFYFAAGVTQVVVVITIVASNDNPDYKVPWLLIVLLIPVGGFMGYFLFYSRRPSRRYRKRMAKVNDLTEAKTNDVSPNELYKRDPSAGTQAQMLCSVSGSRMYYSENESYFPLGDDVFPSMMKDLEAAKHFIFLEYFIIEDGLFWNSVLEVLKRKVKQGVDVKLIYDDIGCMATLPGDYCLTLRRLGIDAVIFSPVRGNADSEINNRSHRKILVVDGKIGYTGGFNLADEYINKIVKYGHWKDVGLRLEGNAVRELTRLFFTDFALNSLKMPEILPMHFPQTEPKTEPGNKSENEPKNESGIETENETGYLIPFGDGPHPFYERRVGKSVIQNMLAAANRYMWIMTPYLIIDNELCMSLENAALRGVDVRLILPHIPDKKLVFQMTKSYYPQLMNAGVKIYEYTPGFIHAKCYLADDKYAMVGTINMDYRSLVHHYEDGVWMYRCKAIRDIRKDFVSTFEKSKELDKKDLNTDLFHRFIRAVFKAFAPMM